jgi:hypothetical protein
MGSAQVTLRRSDEELPEMIACTCAGFPRVFLTVVVVQSVGNVEPFGARMRNLVSRPFFGCFRI